jgi:carbon-monoxide dehydrogenase medium subunit
VKPAPFRYLRAESAEQVTALLAEHGPDVKVLAGGQSLLPAMNMRLARPAALVDLHRVRELDYARLDDGALAIGAATRQRDAELWAEGRARCPILAEALRHVGHVEIRHRGTVCGSLAHADPAAELPLVTLALDGRLVARSRRGARAVAAGEFFRGYLTTALAADEWLAEARLPVPPREAGWAFVELARRHGDFALVAVAALLEVGNDGTCARARVALGGVGPMPLRAAASERILVGQKLTAEVFAAAGEVAAHGLEPPTDAQASGSYRRKVAAVLVKRALAQASARLGAGDAR